MSDMLQNIIARNNSGEHIATPSVCSANPEVLSASLQLASNPNRPLVIEATSNLVNQVSGCTRMDARKFVAFIADLKSKHWIESSIVKLGDDHLRPQVWKLETADMEKVQDLVSDYVRSGIKKIKPDCSEGCADEPPLIDIDTAAARAADLAVSSLDAASAPEEISFVIGTEVPPPSGVRLGDGGHIIPISSKSIFKTLMAHLAALAEKGIEDSWPQVSGLEVQPSIEFGPDEVFTMSKGTNSGFRDAISECPEICFEADSTDFQQPEIFAKLENTVLASPNVGPALTFALGRKLYVLDRIVQKQTALAVALTQGVEAAMREKTEYWQSHYSESDISKRYFSYADRIRYYKPLPAVKEPIDNLIFNFDKLKISKHVLEQSLSTDAPELSEVLAASHGRTIVRIQVQGVLLPCFLEQRDV